MDRKKIVLVFLLVILAVCLIYRITHPFKQERVGQLTYTNQGRNNLITVKIKPSQEKNDELENLHALQDRFFNPPVLSGKVINNPFVRKKELSNNINKAPEIGNLSENHSAQENDPLYTLTNEISRFKIFGAFESEGKRAIFFGRGKEMLIVRAGDRIDGKYLVQSISDESITIKADGVDDSVTIDMRAF